MIKMRTLPQAVEELKSLDPDSAVTLSLLRLLVKRGEIPVVPIRNRQLVNMESVLDYFNGTTKKQTVKNTACKEYGMINNIGG